MLCTKGNLDKFIQLCIRMSAQKTPGRDTLFLLKKSAIALTVKAGGFITQYLFIFTVARLLGPGSLGGFTLSYTVVQLVSILALMGIDNLLIRKVAAAKAAGTPAEMKAAYITALQITGASSLVLAIVLFLASPILAVHVFHKPWLSDSLQIAALGLPPFVWITLHAAAFRGSKNMLGFTLFKTILPLLNSCLLLLAWHLQWPITPVAGFTLSAFVVVTGYVFAWYTFSGVGGLNKTPLLNKRAMILESLPMMITGSVFFILNWIDNLVIGIYRTEAEVGFYDTAFKISSASAAVLMAVNAIQAPTFAEIHSTRNYARLRRYVFNSTRLLFYATAPITLALLLFPELILSIFGKAFEVSSKSLQILAIGNFINCITGSVGILLMMTGYQQGYNRIIVVAAIVGIALNFLLVPVMGIEGAAVASTVAKILWNLAAVWYVYTKLQLVSIYLPGMRAPKADGQEREYPGNKEDHTLTNE